MVWRLGTAYGRYPVFIRRLERAPEPADHTSGLTFTLTPQTRVPQTTECYAHTRIYRHVERESSGLQYTVGQGQGW